MDGLPEPAVDLRLRPERWPEDEVFLRRVFASTREEEFRAVGWPPAVLTAFLDQQFDAQRTHYRREYGASSFDVVTLDGEPVGRLYVDRAPADLCVVDIALLPTARGRGIGGRLMRALLDEAAAAGRAVILHVETNNPAFGWYQRLGFLPQGEPGVYQEMRWQPSQPKTA